MLPLAVLLSFFVGIISILIFGNSVLLLYGWRKGIFLSDIYLYLGIGFLVFSVLGRFFILLLFRKKDTDPPKVLKPDEKKDLTLTDGSKIRVNIFGKENESTLIMIHGWGTDTNLWYYQIKTLQKNFRVFAYDLPGLGKSTPPEDMDYSLSRMAQQLKEIIENENVKPVIIGHSIGGMITQTLDRDHPDFFHENVKGIILIHTTYTDPVRTSAFNNVMLAIKKPLLVPLNYLTIAISPIMRIINFFSYLNGSAHLLARYSVFEGHVTRDQLDFAAKYLYKASPAINARGTLGMFNYDCENSIQNIHVPTLIIAGEYDRLTLKGASEIMCKKIQNSTLKIIQSGHAGILEQHEKVNEYVVEFLESNKAL